MLATTDIHMNLFGYDYVSDTQGMVAGLAGLSRLISAARAEAAERGMPTILLDNGDLLQGSAMGDYLATQPVTSDHPTAATLRHMRYDAVGLGNHDLDYGLSYVNAFADAVSIPVISSNLSLSTHTSLVRNAIVFPKSNGHTNADRPQLRVGVLSVLPAQTAVWNHHVLEDNAIVETPSESLSSGARRLRLAGADIIVLLAHMSIEDANHHSESVEGLLHLSSTPQIDMIIAGHTHRRFPNTNHPSREDADTITGQLAGRPAIMPGHSGSDLAVLDLTLRHTKDKGWHVAKHQGTLKKNQAGVKADPCIVSIASPTHEKTRARLSQPVGQIAWAMHNFFSLAVPTRTCAIVASAKARAAREALVGLAEAKLPLLVTAAAHTAGGRAGPDHYLDIPSGMLLRRHLSGLCPYANTIWLLRVDTETLRLWLEHAAEVYTHLNPDDLNQPLLDPEIPPFHFDTIYGLTYTIDPTEPVGNRVKALRFQGRPVSTGQEFLLATNQFRAAGGGGFPPLHKTRLFLKTHIRTEDAIRRLLSARAKPIWEDHLPWRFSCRKPVRAVLETTPKALAHLPEIAHFRPQPLAQSQEGFARIRLTL
ncbi:MAG: 5'-nucleotidase C-terminal domain-containing protein [Pseudomonadota bacterium]